MVQSLEHGHGPSQSQISAELDLETLKSSSLLHADEATKTSPREIAMWSAAALVAIVIGVIPALWINRWRDDGTAAAVEATRSQSTTDDTPGEPAGEPTAQEPAYAPTRATTVAPTLKASKPIRAKSERVKHPPPSRTRKPPAAAPPPPPPAAKTCDVYLHPKGCPR